MEALRREYKQKRLDFKISLRHLKKDQKLRGLIEAHKKITLSPSKNPFQSLAEAIIYQQLSGKAASTILKRFIALYSGKKFPTPTDVEKTSIKKLRSVGLSNQKASYLLDLAKKFKDGTISPRNFHRMTDEEISAHLIQVKGIGQWTADMFLMFALNRPNVLPVGDLGIRKAFQKLFEFQSLPSGEKMQKLACKWEGHRTVACLYLWKSIDEQ